MLAILAPTVVLGIVPIVVAWVIAAPLLLYLGVVMVLAGGGDILIAIRLATYKSKGKDCLFFDHPYEVGLAVFERPVNMTETFK